MRLNFGAIHVISRERSQSFFDSKGKFQATEQNLKSLSRLTRESEKTFKSINQPDGRATCTPYEQDQGLVITNTQGMDYQAVLGIAGIIYLAEKLNASLNPDTLQSAYETARQDLADLLPLEIVRKIQQLRAALMQENPKLDTRAAYVKYHELHEPDAVHRVGDSPFKQRWSQAD